MWMDRQTDGHINLIGRLVTSNPPKNNRKSVAMVTAVGKCCLKNQITKSSCNEHILNVLNSVKCPQNEKPRNKVTLK